LVIYFGEEFKTSLQAIFVAGAAGGRGKFSIDKGPEDAFGLRVGLLVPVVGPDLLG